MLETSDLEFEYPDELVALSPVSKGTSRILLVSRDRPVYEEINWSRFLSLFKSGDTLVLNETRVLPARLIVNRPSGKKGEVFFLSQTDNGHVWQVLTKNMNLKAGKVIELPGQIKAEVMTPGRITTIRFTSPVDTIGYLNEFGEVPLPPYITELRGTDKSRSEDKESYQTSWAKSWGSVAAPTAGLHFTKAHLDELEKAGVNIRFITLHVGAGTFMPLDEGKLKELELHSEVVEVGLETCQSILKTQAAGKCVWACGTTVARALESAVWGSGTGGTNIPMIAPFRGETKLFIHPGYKFQVVEALLTNFHQPRSSLLALVAAFGSRVIPASTQDARSSVEKVKQVYKYAIEKKFRLFSYGDLTVWR
ncbi:MAG: tRNA preQ1(34) S-adenosylmethionine ribosyltransferase-isomerase QueA [Oligoflexia bacterium]|nr:tRNA preQ1(34) S-adenosylmethionine ribosyltransferase-isomerase QueA [Oligoflexia bacterium]